jgi:hypothetical protein
VSAVYELEEYDHVCACCGDSAPIDAYFDARCGIVCSGCFNAAAAELAGMSAFLGFIAAASAPRATLRLVGAL